jgi:competence protein ComEA
VPADGPDEIKAPRNRAWLLLLWIPLFYGVFTLGAWSLSRSPQPPPTGPYQNVNAAPPGKLLVHVAGAVRHPGLYQLPFDARINDAVKRAGPLPDADVNALNLAAWAEDGSRIEVPRKIKNVAAHEPLIHEPLIEVAPQPEEKKSINLKPTDAGTETKAAKPAATPKKPSKAPTRIININRASLDDFMLLPGVGPALAQRILDYRKENGAFSSVDDLDEVKGIGPKKLEKLRAWATVK